MLHFCTPPSTHISNYIKTLYIFVLQVLYTGLNKHDRMVVEETFLYYYDDSCVYCLYKTKLRPLGSKTFWIVLSSSKNNKYTRLYNVVFIYIQSSHFIICCFEPTFLTLFKIYLITNDVSSKQYITTGRQS